jgi:ribonuclease HII
MLLSWFNENYVEAGLDEAGRGCLAGPVVAAAVILPKDYKNQWLNDSKQLSKTMREQLRKEVEREALSWAVAEASNTEVDEINILKASFLAMHRAIDSLSKTLLPEHLLIDGNRFNPYPMIPHTCVVKGDAKYMSIAAASVLAKTHRDAIMEELDAVYPMYGWGQNAGYPTIFHRKAVLQHGHSPLHRVTFKVRI